MINNKNYIGLGTYGLNDREIILNAFRAALESGYKLIDTAAAYLNEMSIGKVLHEMNITRENLFVQGKVWITNMGFKEVQEACKKSLKKLKLDYFDAYLIHWPVKPELDIQTWLGLIELQNSGLVRYIGVSNFKADNIINIMRSGVKPSINQIEIHPGFLDLETVNFCAANNIDVQAYSPLGNGKILDNKILNNIADAHGKTPAQVCLKWEMAKGFTPIPKSSKPEKIKENINIFDFELAQDELAAIDSLPFTGKLSLDFDEVIELAGYSRY